MFNIIKSVLGVAFLFTVMILVFNLVASSIFNLIPNSIGATAGIFIGIFASLCVMILGFRIGTHSY